MSINAEVFMQTLVLLDTLSEGLEYISSLIAEGKEEAALEIMYDTLSGVDSIINVLNPVMGQLPANKLKMLELDMSDKFNKLIELFKKKDGVLLKDYLDSDVSAAFSDWKREVKRLLMPFILS